VLKLLVIDDEHVVREGLKTIIDWEKYGYYVCGEGTDGRDGLKKIRTLQPDLVLVDIKMPGLSGIEVIKETRKEEKGFGTKFIILTGYSDFEYAQKAIQLQARSYLLKPIDEDELIETIIRIRQEIERDSKLKKIRENEVTNITNIKELYDAIDDGDFEKLDIVFTEMEEFFKQGHITIEDIKEFCVQCFMEIKDKFTFNYYDKKEEITPNEVVIKNINNRKSLHELLEYIKDEMITISSILCENSSEHAIRRIINYINTNYYKDLKVETLGEIFHYNSAYLGKLFKNYTKQSFNTYLDKVRIEKAKELLLGSDLKVYQVSEKVGYRNIDYFYTKFRKYEKLSPNQYKNKSKKKRE